MASNRFFVLLQRLLIALIGLFISIEMAFAAEVSSIQEISFGGIDLHPAGDTITIAANGGPAAPTAIRSIVVGGGSGKITITSPMVEHVDIIYPPAAPLFHGADFIVLDGIDVNSQYNAGGADTLGGGLPLEISVGGKITVPAGTTSGSYSGNLTILLNFS